MSASRLLGLIFVFALICDKGRTALVTPVLGQDQVPQANQNSFSIEIPLSQGNVIQADNKVQTVQRRLSLEDFFLNRNQQEQQPSPPPIQAPVTQFQVQQPDPNSLLLVRDAQFPNPTGGLVSRLLLARRMLRLRRIARRLTLIPRLFGLGLRQTLQRSAQNPLSLFANRIGEAYDPREFVFGNKGFSYKNNATSNAQQQDANADQLQQQSRGYAVEADPYYGEVRDSNYDPLDSSNVRGSDNYEDLNQLRQQQDILNSLTDEQQILLLQQLQNYQQQLNQLNERLNDQPNNNQINEQYQQQPQQNYQNEQASQYQPGPQKDQVQQSQPLNDQQIEQIRQLQLQLLKEQQQQQQHLQQLQLTQQAQNLRQHQNFASIEQDSNFQENNNQQHDANNAGGRAEGSAYLPSVGIGNLAGGSYGSGGQTVGVGINVGLRPPGVDIQVTKPEISGLPPVVNPIVPKPLPQAPVAEPLVPIGILPKPILNLKGRLFFGAEVGKGASLRGGNGR